MSAVRKKPPRKASGDEQGGAAREGEGLFRTLVDAAPIPMAITRLSDGVILYANEQAGLLAGLPPGELVGRRTLDFYRDPAERQALLEALARDGFVRNREIRGKRADGSPAWVVVSLHATVFDGEPALFVGLHDITERKRAEEALTRQALELKRSNDELEQFAYVASHDLQEPLRKIQSFGDRLRAKSEAGLDDEGRDYLKRMQEATKRMQGLINDLLTLSRVTTQGKSFEPVDLNAVAREAISDLEVQIEQTGGRVEVEDLPTLEADGTQMRQLLQNLIHNGLKFHRAEAPPVVRVSGQTQRSPAEAQCQVFVEDNGIGFEEKFADRIFGVFQRLHGRSEYEGSGIGLPICRKIAERHGGSITARGAPGQGATFTITLPVQQPPGRDGGSVD